MYFAKTVRQKNTVTAGNFNTLLSATFRTTRQKISEDVEVGDNATNQQYLVDISRTRH